MTRFFLRLTAIWLVLIPFAASAQYTAPMPRGQPEMESGWARKMPVRASHHMVVAAHPLAAGAAREILRKGGSAIDAAITAQLVLNLVEPQSSGLGGGGFIVHWDAKSESLRTYDGRETAPAAAKPDRFFINGRHMAYYEAVKSARSVGVPGLARMLDMAYAKHGRLPWDVLFAPAIKLAEEGFPVGKRLNRLLRASRTSTFSPRARAYFFDSEGKPWPVGHTLKNPELAETLRELAAKGADAFYSGPIAEGIVETVKNGPQSLNDMTLEDIAGYQAHEQAAVCGLYRNFKICGMGPPSSGALTILMSLKMLQPFNLGRKPLNALGVHFITEAQKLAYADRRRYMADDRFVPVPEGLLDDGYLLSRGKLIDVRHSMPNADPGKPPGVRHGAFGRDKSIESSGTTQISIVDKDGNAVSMTTTIESGFGSGLMTGGFLLNNEMTDFAFTPKDSKGRPVANRVEGGKRPRSSMSPTIVFDKRDKLRMVLGSPGGSRIMLYVMKALIAHIDWGLDAQSSVTLPAFGSRNGPFEIEEGPWSAAPARAMMTRGHRIMVATMTSGLHVIVADNGRLEGGADPRREGVALGD